MNVFVLAYLLLAQERRNRSEQILLTEAAQVVQGTYRKTETGQHLLTNLFARYTDINLSFYDICPVDSFERVN